MLFSGTADSPVVLFFVVFLTKSMIKLLKYSQTNWVPAASKLYPNSEVAIVAGK